MKLKFFSFLIIVFAFNSFSMEEEMDCSNDEDNLNINNSTFIREEKEEKKGKKRKIKKPHRSYKKEEKKRKVNYFFDEDDKPKNLTLAFIPPFNRDNNSFHQSEELTLGPQQVAIEEFLNFLFPFWVDNKYLIKWKANRYEYGLFEIHPYFKNKNDHKQFLAKISNFLAACGIFNYEISSASLIENGNLVRIALKFHDNDLSLIYNAIAASNSLVSIYEDIKNQYPSLVPYIFTNLKIPKNIMPKKNEINESLMQIFSIGLDINSRLISYIFGEENLFAKSNKDELTHSNTTSSYGNENKDYLPILSIVLYDKDDREIKYNACYSYKKDLFYINLDGEDTTIPLSNEFNSLLDFFAHAEINHSLFQRKFQLMKIPMHISGTNTDFEVRMFVDEHGNKLFRVFAANKLFHKTFKNLQEFPPLKHLPSHVIDNTFSSKNEINKIFNEIPADSSLQFKFCGRTALTYANIHFNNYYKLVTLARYFRRHSIPCLGGNSIISTLFLIADEPIKYKIKLANTKPEALKNNTAYVHPNKEKTKIVISFIDNQNRHEKHVELDRSDLYFPDLHSINKTSQLDFNQKDYLWNAILNQGIFVKIPEESLTREISKSINKIYFKNFYYSLKNSVNDLDLPPFDEFEYEMERIGVQVFDSINEQITSSHNIFSLADKLARANKKRFIALPNKAIEYFFKLSGMEKTKKNINLEEFLKKMKNSMQTIGFVDKKTEEEGEEEDKTNSSLIINNKNTKQILAKLKLQPDKIVENFDSIDEFSTEFEAMYYLSNNPFAGNIASLGEYTTQEFEKKTTLKLTDKNIEKLMKIIISKDLPKLLQ
jgi:hypothetical protein